MLSSPFYQFNSKESRNLRFTLIYIKMILIMALAAIFVKPTSVIIYFEKNLFFRKGLSI